MKKMLSILILLGCLKTIGQINLSFNNVYQSGYDQIIESIYYTEFKKQGVSLFVTNEERKLGIISLADSLGNTLCLSDFKGNGELNSCTIYAPALDDVMLRYYLSGGSGVPCELPLCDPSDDFCLIEELNSENPALGIGYYFIENESPRISRFRFASGAKDNFSIPLLLNTQQYSIVSELDVEGNGIKKTYNNEGKLIHSSLYKNGVQVDYRSYP
jgi:antitoxin component YwqK of YwqJK toxin-antitoxin module